MEKRMMDAAAVSDRGEWMERGAIWIICVEEIGGWAPRLDLPPALDENVAKAFAREQTVMSDRQHQARRFDPVVA